MEIKRARSASIGIAGLRSQRRAQELDPRLGKQLPRAACDDGVGAALLPRHRRVHDEVHLEVLPVPPAYAAQAD